MEDLEPHPGARGSRKGRKKKKGSFDFKRPEDLGVKKKEEPSDLFTIKKESSKKGETCPVCGAGMTFKERVDSWYCPRCKSFY